MPFSSTNLPTHQPTLPLSRLTRSFAERVLGNLPFNPYPVAIIANSGFAMAWLNIRVFFCIFETASFRRAESGIIYSLFSTYPAIIFYTNPTNTTSHACGTVTIACSMLSYPSSMGWPVQTSVTISFTEVSM